MNTTLQAQPTAAPATAVVLAVTRARRARRVAAHDGLAGRSRSDGRQLSSAAAATLVRRAAGGDTAAWDALVDAYGGMVWSVARSYRLGDADAADVCQSTWLHLVEHIDRLHDPGRVAGWLATTARRAALRIARHNVRMLPTDRDLTHASWHADDATGPLEAAERAARMRRALASLPERDQALLTLLAAEPPRSYEQIARELDMPVGSIGPTRARCLERLRRAALRVGLEACA
jgi:RNA polymerase sigma factor (sigma-70 family)